MQFRKLPRAVAGSLSHRSGWPYAMASLSSYFSDYAPVLLDDFADRMFRLNHPAARPLIHTLPWVGIFHHPVSMPSWYGTDDLQHLISSTNFQRSLPSLRMAITFSPQSASWIQEKLSVPTYSIPHPTEASEIKWSPAVVNVDKNIPLVQVGSFLRNTEAIHQLRTTSGISKFELVQDGAWIDIARSRCRQRYAGRPRIAEVTRILPLGPSAYDNLLATSVVFIELIDAIANNTILECIARATPILVNRLAGPEYYLGTAYPLFYEDFDTASALLTKDNILRAHKYLLERAQHLSTGADFASSMSRLANLNLPEFRDHDCSPFPMSCSQKL